SNLVFSGQRHNLLLWELTLPTPIGLPVGVSLGIEQQHLLLCHSSFVLIVGANDALHQVMPHYVALVEVYEGQTFDFLENINRLEQSAASRVWQINLRDVAGD